MMNDDAVCRPVSLKGRACHNVLYSRMMCQTDVATKIQGVCLITNCRKLREHARRHCTMQCGQSLHSGSDTSQVALVVGYKRVEREGEQETHSTGRRDSEQEKQRTRETENTRLR
jgi:hypothetical protein